MSASSSILIQTSSSRSCSSGEGVGVVKRVHTLLGGVHRLATALKKVEEVREEVQEIKDEWEDEEVKENGDQGRRETLITCVDMRNTMRCNVNHDDTNLTNKQENCALTCQCSCALC